MLVFSSILSPTKASTSFSTSPSLQQLRRMSTLEETLETFGVDATRPLTLARRTDSVASSSNRPQKVYDNGPGLEALD
ncbi:hypothetical protein PENTCL1PPCAC_24416, partial [Pristionchus entomophagus]